MKMISPRNPLLFPQIIHQTLKYCDFNTLKRCRLVCQLWEEKVNKILAVKKCPIVITCVSKKNQAAFCDIIACNYNNFSNNVIIDKNVKVTDAIPVLMHSYAHSEFQNFKIQFLEVQNGPWNSSQFSTILQNLPHLKELTLSENFILPKLTTQHSIHLYNLTSLHLNLTDEYLQNFANLEFISELCKCAPNLCEITCNQKRFSEPVSSQTTIFSKILFRTVLDFYSSSPPAEKLPQYRYNLLSYLDINVDLRDEDLDLLQGVGLPLKSLHLPINSVISSQTVDELLSSLNSTLTKLKITFRSSTVKLPALECIKNLQKLAIHGTGSEFMGGLDNQTRYRRRSSFGIGFAPPKSITGSADESENSTSQPGLYKYTDIDLDLDETISYIFNVAPTTLFPNHDEKDFKALKYLTQLQLKSVYYIPKDVFHLRDLFPNLSQLKMSFLDDNLLQYVIKGFPQLECLGAMEGFYTDTSITGISPEVQDLVKNYKVSQAYDTKRLREFPCLLNLSNLKILELGSPRVTSFGVINSVCLCNSVEEFVLDFPQMDDTSLLSFDTEMQPSNWNSITVKAGSFSDIALQRMQTQSYNRRRKFEYHADRN